MVLRSELVSCRFDVEVDAEDIGRIVYRLYLLHSRIVFPETVLPHVLLFLLFHRQSIGCRRSLLPASGGKIVNRDVASPTGPDDRRVHARRSEDQRTILHRRERQDELD